MTSEFRTEKPSNIFHAIDKFLKAFLCGFSTVTTRFFLLSMVFGVICFLLYPIEFRFVHNIWLFLFCIGLERNLQNKRRFRLNCYGFGMNDFANANDVITQIQLLVYFFAAFLFTIVTVILLNYCNTQSNCSMHRLGHSYFVQWCFFFLYSFIQRSKSILDNIPHTATFMKNAKNNSIRHADSYLKPIYVTTAISSKTINFHYAKDDTAHM